MKNVFIIALIGAAALGTSCKRNNCWKCTTVFSSTGNSSWLPPGGSAARTAYCDKTEAEIRQVEKDGTGVQTHTKNGNTYTSRAVTTCK